MDTAAAPRLDRLDRHVWRSFVRMGAGTSRYRATCALEEALRLADLPGEREGRVYYFRRVSLGAIASQAGRQIWMDRVQRTLGELAATAVHGSDPRAVASNAVYFDNREQALEALLRRSLRAGSCPAWYAAAALGDVPEASTTISILRIVERLRQPDLPPAAAAAIILSALGHADPAPLLNALPIGMVREWLREMEGIVRAPAPSVPMSLPGSLKATLRLASQQFGWMEPRTLWLAVLGTMTHASGPLAAGEAVRRARSMLRRMQDEQQAQDLPAQERSAPKGEGRGTSIVRTDGAQGLRFETDSLDGGSTMPRIVAACDAAADAPVEREQGETAEQRAAQREAPAASAMAAWALLGEPTAAAGLYFLLHVLRHLGIADALAANPAVAEAGFVAHLLKRLAAHAQVDADDPILQCLNAQTANPFPDRVAVDAQAWPRSWPAAPRALGDGRALLRHWSLAARRWCLRTAGITVREIVRRGGRVWLTRMDLDVTLPLSAADVRIRRIGLDIDPGWLPWFGRLGRVVRFHYQDRESPEVRV
jgi:hypothetical protein